MCSGNLSEGALASEQYQSLPRTRSRYEASRWAQNPGKNTEWVEGREAGEELIFQLKNTIKASAPKKPMVSVFWKRIHLYADVALVWTGIFLGVLEY